MIAAGGDVEGLGIISLHILPIIEHTPVSLAVVMAIQRCIIEDVLLIVLVLVVVIMEPAHLPTDVPVTQDGQETVVQKILMNAEVLVLTTASNCVTTIQALMCVLAIWDIHWTVMVIHVQLFHVGVAVLMEELVHHPLHVFVCRDGQEATVIQILMSVLILILTTVTLTMEIVTTLRALIYVTAIQDMN